MCGVIRSRAEPRPKILIFGIVVSQINENEEEGENFSENENQNGPKKRRFRPLGLAVPTQSLGTLGLGA